MNPTGIHDKNAWSVAIVARMSSGLCVADRTYKHSSWMSRNSLNNKENLVNKLKQKYFCWKNTKCHVKKSSWRTIYKLESKVAKKTEAENKSNLLSEDFSSLIFCCVISPLEKSKISSLRSCKLLNWIVSNHSKYVN